MTSKLNHTLGYAQPAMLVMVTLVWVLFRTRINNDLLFYGLTAVCSIAVTVLERLGERHRQWRSNLRELGTDTFYTLVYWGITITTADYLDNAIFRLGTRLGTTHVWPSHAPFVVQGLLTLVLYDLGAYWMHRLMHHSPLWRFHAPHHHLVQLNALKANVGHPIELWLINFTFLPLLGAPLDVSLYGGSMVLLIALFAHANVAGTPPRWFSFFFTTLPAHASHHRLGFAETRCNYANAFILWDRVFGTFHDGEPLADGLGQGTQKRLSIPQQFAYSFRSPKRVEDPVWKPSK